MLGLIDSRVNELLTALMSPWEALMAYKRLILTLPLTVHDSLDYLHAWLAVACTHLTRAAESIEKAKWQSPHVDRRMIVWMQRHTQYVNAMPGGAMAMPAGPALLIRKNALIKPLKQWPL
jgi:hypothetical protein